MATSSKNTRTRAALGYFCLGMFLIQIAWQLAVPAFRGIDEIDHAYRATSVARGQIIPKLDAVADGRGFAVKAPAGMVSDAVPACKALRYTGPDNCYAIQQEDDSGDVLIASAAEQYSPVYYAIVGWPSLLLDGKAALYFMRLISSLICALILVTAAAIAIRRSRTWLLLGLIACLTPTMIYSTIVVAPNGLSMSGGLLMWVSWLCVDPRDLPSSRGLIFIGAVGASVMIAMHNTGLVWAAASIFVFTLLWWPLKLGRRNRGPLAFPAILVGTTVVLTLGWSLFTGANSPGGRVADDIRLASITEIAALPILWVFQSVFSAPRAGGAPHPIVYAIMLGVIFVFCAAGARLATVRVRLAMLALAVTVTLIPLVLTWKTQHVFGLAWQGRYAIPLGAGILLLAAEALHDNTPARRTHVYLLVPLSLAAAIAVMSARSNVDQEGASFLAPEWVAPALAVVAFVSLWRAAETVRLDAVAPHGSSDAPTDDRGGIAIGRHAGPGSSLRP